MVDLLCLDAVSVERDDGEPLRHISLVVRPGELVALLGPNGSGKSAILRASVGTTHPIRGSAALLGRPVNTRQPDRNIARGVGFVPAGPSLFDRLSVGDNLRLGRRPGPVGIDTVLDWFPPLRPMINRRAGVLSGGEHRLVAMARALVGNPRLLLVDELSSGMALPVAAAMFEALHRMAERYGTGTLFVEQDHRLALAHCDRSYWLHDGRLTEAATTHG